MLTLNISSCQLRYAMVNQIGFCAFCYCKFGDKGSQRVFFAQTISRDVTYDVIYHPFPINSQYLKT